MQLAALGILSTLMLWMLSLAFFSTPDGAIATSLPGVWGDWSLHAAHAWWFAEQPASKWLDVRLLRHDLALAYPPLINWLSGMLLRCGASFYLAMILPLVFFVMVIVWGLMRLNGHAIRSTFRGADAPPARGVVIVAFLASLLVLVGGGSRVFGGLTEYALLPAHSRWPLLDTLAAASRHGILTGPLKQVWLSPLHAQLLPQRTFMAGLAVGVVTIWMLARREPSRNWLVILFPLLVLAHTYSWLVSLLVLGIQVIMEIIGAARSSNASRDRMVGVIRKWLRLAGPGVLLSFVVFLVVMPSSLNKVSGFGWAPGWMAVDANQNVFFFWLVNWNVFVPLAVIALATSRALRRSPLFVSGTVLFLGMNSFRLQPWVWDSSKFLLWAVLLMAGPLGGWMLTQLTVPGRLWRNVSFAAFTLSFLLMDGLVSICMDVMRPRDPMNIWSMNDQVIAAWAREHLPKDALILSPSPDDHRYWAYALTGRRNVQAYSGWMWSHGLPYEPTLSTMKTMFEDPVGNIEVLRALGITHIAVPDQEPRGWKTNRDALTRSFTLLIKTEGEQVYVINKG